HRVIVDATDRAVSLDQPPHPLGIVLDRRRGRRLGVRIGIGGTLFEPRVALGVELDREVLKAHLALLGGFGQPRLGRRRHPLDLGPLLAQDVYALRDRLVLVALGQVYAAAVLEALVEEADRFVDRAGTAVLARPRTRH